MGHDVISSGPQLQIIFKKIHYKERESILLKNKYSLIALVPQTDL